MDIHYPVKNEPKYIRIYKELRGRILTDGFVDNGQLPTELQLMEQFGVSRTTIRKATEMLRADNLIESRQGYGTDVTLNKKTPNAGQMNRITDVIDIDFTFTPEPLESTKHSDVLVDVVPVPGKVASALDLTQGDNVYRLRWLHYVNDIPYLYLTNYVRMDLAPTLPQVVEGMVSLYPILAREYGLIFDRAEETIEPIVSDFISAKLLDVPVGTPLLQLCRSTHFNKGPAEYGLSIIRPDLLNITLKIR